MDERPSINWWTCWYVHQKIWYFLIQSSMHSLLLLFFFYYYYSFARSIRAFALLMGWKYALLFQHTWLWFTVCDNSIIIIVIIINLVLIIISSSSSRIWFGYWYRLTMELSLNGWLLPATKCKKVNLSRSNFNIQSQSSVSLLMLLLLLLLFFNRFDLTTAYTHAR